MKESKSFAFKCSANSRDKAAFTLNQLEIYQDTDMILYNICLFLCEILVHIIIINNDFTFIKKHTI